MNIYYFNINEFENLSADRLLTPQRRQRMNRYRSYEDRARCLAGGLLLRRFLDITDDSQLISGPHGKPYLKEDGTFFNISHSGDYVVLAVADCEIGIDIEKHNKKRLNVAKRFFTPEENEWLSQNTDEQTFFDIWTAKEAVMKSTGLGFTLSPTSFSVLPLLNGTHFIHGKYLYLSWHSIGSHSLCIASQKSQEESNFIPVTYQTLITEH